MPTNDFLAFATGGGANVESQASYSADPQTGLGWTALTVAQSSKVNKAMRQGNWGTALVTTFINSLGGYNTLDDGDLASDVTEFTTSVRAAAATDPSTPFVIRANNGLDFQSLTTTLLNLNGVVRSRQIIAGTGLSGGGDLTADRTLSVVYGSSAGTAAQGNDTRIVNAVQISRQIIAGNGINGGGNLGADVTISVAHDSTLTFSGSNLSVVYGTTAGTAAQGNDSRITGALQSSANLGDVSSVPSSLLNLGIKAYRTSNYTPTAATGQSESHSLGNLPTDNNYTVQLWLVNTNAEFGYNPGDNVPINEGGTSRNDGALPCVSNTTISFGIGNNGCYVIPHGGGNAQQITPANWEIYAIVRYH